MMSRSTEGLWGVNGISWETGTRYVQSEVVQIPALLTIWDHYFSRYMWKGRTEGDMLNQEKFCESVFLVIMI